MNRRFKKKIQHNNTTTKHLSSTTKRPIVVSSTCDDLRGLQIEEMYIIKEKKLKQEQQNIRKQV